MSAALHSFLNADLTRLPLMKLRRRQTSQSAASLTTFLRRKMSSLPGKTSSAIRLAAAVTARPAKEQLTAHGGRGHDGIDRNCGESGINRRRQTHSEHASASRARLRKYARLEHTLATALMNRERSDRW